MHDYVKKFIECGIGVIPVKYREKIPDFSLLPVNHAGKHEWEPYKTRLPSHTELKQWFHHGFHNYGVVLGWNDLVVLDFDAIMAYNTWRTWCSRMGGIAEEVASGTFQVRTGRGVHVYIRLPHREKNRRLKNLDIKADGYVLGPGSVHPCNRKYHIMRDHWDFVPVNALSEVLPAELLAKEQPARIIAEQPYKECRSYVDPWFCAMQAGNSRGPDLVSTIHRSYRIEQFVKIVKCDGRWALGLCPLHDDHSPSFWINIEKQICGCFAGCTDRPMDVINLYARLYGLSNIEAIHRMAQVIR